MSTPVRAVAGPVVQGIGRVVLGVAVAFAIVFALGVVTRMQRASLPAVTGQFSVGRTELALTDATRVDPFAADGRKRELALWIWYPAVTDDDRTTAPYFPDGWSQLPSSVPLGQDLSLIATNAYPNAQLVGQPPVVVLQPGLGLPVGSYSAIAEDLASHGYAVIGINETGSAGTVFPDGRVVPATDRGTVMASDVDAWYEAAGRVTRTWAADAQFVVRSLATTPPAIGALDFSHVAYVGHSVGGASAFEACSRDPRCAAAVNLDGTLWTAVRHSGLEAPHLLIQKAAPETCDEFCRRAGTDFDAVMADGGRQVSIAGSVHASFQDDGLLPAIANRFGLGSIEGRRMSEIVRDVVRTFLDVHLRGSAPADFDAVLSRYPEVSVIR